MVDRASTIAAAACAAALWHGDAAAQFYPVNLPNGDFRWQWGEVAEPKRSLRDFSSSGHEAGFTCQLTGALRPGSRIEDLELRRLESELGISLYFIQAATRVMNELDYQRDLDWAVLDCKLPEAREPDPEAQQERLDRLRERALRRQAERRERRGRAED
ncbi:MAG TPA: hypothetical protein VF339_10070 [Gammaproteobacteria bacterium]